MTWDSLLRMEAKARVRLRQPDQKPGGRHLKSYRLLPLLMLIPAAVACADTPAFDRPGIAFSTTTLPPLTFSWEQSLPGVVRDSSDGTRTTLYSTDTVLRAGLIKNLEIQLSTSLFNHLRTETAGVITTDHGTGDTGIALKLAVPLDSARLSLAVLGGVSFDSGDAAFTAGAAQYSLGSTASWAIDEKSSVSAYANVDRLRSQNSWTISPAYNYALSDKISSFVEAGATYAKGSDADYIAGGGFTWMVRPTVQLDVSADWGLTSASTDVQAGFGISVFFQ